VRISQFFGEKSEAKPADGSAKGLRFLLHLPNFVKLYWRLFHDPRVPLFPKALVVVAILYALSPLDLLPDWSIPFVGQLDDIAVLILAFRAFIPLCPRAVVQEHVQLIDEGK